MTPIVMITVLLAGTLIQLHMPAPAFLAGARFPFLAAVVVYYALNRTTMLAMVAAFLAGIVHDSLSLLPLGYSSACLAGIGWIIGLTRGFVVAESPLTQSFFGAVAGALFNLSLYLLSVPAGLAGHSAGTAALKIFASALFGAICAPLVCIVVGKLDRMTGSVDEEASLEDVE